MSTPSALPIDDNLKMNAETSNEDKLATGSRYLLPSDNPESERLDLQNRILKRAFGDIVFAPLKLMDGDAVLDSGTGTACWMVDCRDTFKEEVHYYGIDITSNLFPAVDNVTTRLHPAIGNILRFEEKWSDRSYKLVNQRLLVAALSAEDWEIAIGNIYKVLAPGGWVQLVESAHCYSGDATRRHRLVLERIFEKRGLLLDPVKKIPNLLHDASFAEISTKNYEVSLGKWAGHEGVEARDNFIGVYRGMKHPVVNVMNIMSSLDFDFLIEEMKQEWDSLPGSKILFSIFCAQKPHLTP